jgi:cell division ATPase FtsA
MRIPFISRSGGKIVAIADIGGGGSAVALLRSSSAGPAELVAYTRTHMNLEERDLARSLTQLSASLGEAAQAAHTAAAQQKLPAPRELYAIVHAPWIVSKTLSAQRTFDKETRITDALIGELAKEALAADPSVVRENLAEASVSHVELNGYPVHEPSKHSAHHVKVIVLASEIQKEHRDALQAALQTSFPGLTIKWRSYIRALSSLLHDRGGDGRNAVVVDIADDGTAIAVLRKQELSSFANVPAGLLHQLKALQLRWFFR